MKTPEELAFKYARDSCKFYEARDGFLAGYAAANRWIPVEEDLPPLNKLVIVSAKSVPPTYGWFDGGFWAINDEPDYSKTKIDYVTFIERWQPLPTK